MPAPVPATSPPDLESLERRIAALERNQRLVGEFMQATAIVVRPLLAAFEKLQDIGRES